LSQDTFLGLGGYPSRRALFKTNFIRKKWTRRCKKLKDNEFAQKHGAAK
jgi:hypothetical protein